MTEPIWEKGYTQNRELSWLQFNARVLEEAEDETVPLLERVKFLSIFTSNLDEFYMIRVGSLGDVAALGGHGVDNKSGLTAKEQLERIYAATAPLYERRDRVFRRVERELGAEGLQRLRMSELTQDEHHYIRQLFRTAIQPLLSPQIVDAHHPFPHLASKTLHVGVRLSRKKSEFWGLIPMPPSVPELLFLPEQNGICRYVPLEEVLLFYADSVFEMYSTLEKVVFCVTRNADINPDDEPFAPDGREIDLRAKMEKLLRERRRLPGQSLLRAALKRDLFLSYPYESMEPFLQMVREAANAPDVLSIRITIYRLARKAKLVDYLCAAAENGKDVTVLIELRARFDEQNNIDWSERLEEAGCKVLYGFEDYKVHSKICLITLRERGALRHVTQIGTGNYNEKTAKQYTDVSLVTADQNIGADAAAFFSNMALGNLEGSYGTLLVAPHQLKKPILTRIEEQTALGPNGYILMKFNSLTDIDVIHALSRASQAGVRVELIIRGICCLAPGVPGYTDNITVTSIVGRFLEHSRIFCFGRGEQEHVYISSADMMTRNTVRRVEIACPIRSPEIRRRLHEILDAMLADTVKARVLLPDGTYTKKPPSYEPVCAQVLLMKRAVEAAQQQSAAAPQEKRSLWEKLFHRKGR